MMLRQCMLYPGIRTSRKAARLSWFQRDFFYGLLNAVDPMGRFEADVEMLRAALYAPLLSKVSKGDVQGALVACREAGLVNLWTGADGRGYGEVVNYRQTGLRSRKSELPPPPGAPPDPELFTDAAPPVTEPKRRKEEKPPIPPAEAGGSDSSAAGDEPAGPRFARRRRSPQRALAALREELGTVEQALLEMLYPGGYVSGGKVSALRPEQKPRYDELMAKRSDLKRQIKTAEQARREEDAA